jgi:pterin-4a-carbinolamine dehydratase
MRHRIFINYRRETDASLARSITESLKNQFPSDFIFFDTESIEGGKEWPKSIQVALKRSTVVLAVIGPNWLSAAHTNHRRKIDDKTDWVRRELLLALTSSIPIIPLFLEDADVLNKDDLPKDLAPLTMWQAIRVRQDSWSADITRLCEAIRSTLRDEDQTTLIYPPGFKVSPTPLSNNQIEKALEALPAWQLKQTEVSDDARLPRGSRATELVRRFKFKSFLDAIAFMQQTSKTIDEWDHHPKWENAYWNLTVRVSTWDIQHQLSDRDVKLAAFLEKAFNAFPGRD